MFFFQGSKRKADEDSLDSKMKQKRFDKKTCTDLIVLNLPWRADEETLRDYFSQYGDLVMIQVGFKFLLKLHS